MKANTIDPKKIDPKKDAGDPKSLQVELDQLKALTPIVTAVDNPHRDLTLGAAGAAICSTVQ